MAGAAPLRVLLATDGKAAAAAAQALLVAAGDRERLHVTCLSVDSFEIALEEGRRVEGRFSPAAGRRYVKTVAERTAVQLTEAGFQAEPRVAADDPAFRIVDIVTRERFALVMVGAGQTRQSRLPLLGSVSTRVLHESKASVMVVHHPPERDTVRALLGTDGSGDAAVACRILMDFADPARVEVGVLSVARPSIPAAVPGDGPSPRERGLGRDRAEQEALHATAALEGGGFRVSAEVVTGRPRDALVERATTGPYDLVAVGARGQGGIRQALLGSVSDSVARVARAALIARDRPEDV